MKRQVRISILAGTIAMAVMLVVIILLSVFSHGVPGRRSIYDDPVPVEAFDNQLYSAAREIRFENVDEPYRINCFYRSVFRNRIGASIYTESGKYGFFDLYTGDAIFPLGKYDGMDYGLERLYLKESGETGKWGLADAWTREWIIPPRYDTRKELDAAYDAVIGLERKQAGLVDILLYETIPDGQKRVFGQYSLTERERQDLYELSDLALGSQLIPEAQPILTATDCIDEAFSDWFIRYDGYNRLEFFDENLRKRSYYRASINSSIASISGRKVFTYNLTELDSPFEVYTFRREGRAYSAYLEIFDIETGEILRKEAPFYLERSQNKELSPIRRGKDCYVQCDRVELAVDGEIQPEGRNIVLDEEGNVVLNQPYKDQYYNETLLFGTDIIDLGDDRYYHPLSKIVTDSGSTLCLDLLEKGISSVSSKGICVYNRESGSCEMWDRNGVLIEQTESPLYYFGEDAIVRKSDAENRIGYYAHRQGGGEKRLCAEEEMFYLSDKHGLIGCREGEGYVLKNAAGETILSLDEQPEKNSIEVIPMLGYTVLQIGERLYAAEGGLTSQQSVWNMALYQDFLYIKGKGTLVGYPKKL